MLGFHKSHIRIILRQKISNSSGLKFMLHTLFIYFYKKTITVYFPINANDVTSSSCKFTPLDIHDNFVINEMNVFETKQQLFY